jgi:hypothetical protein
MSDEILEEAPSAEEEAPTVPLSRFNEVYKSLKTTQEEIRELKEQKSQGDLSPDQEKELKAKEYLKGLLKETLSEQEKAAKEAEDKEKKDFNSSVDDILSTYTDVKRDDFLKFMETKAKTYKVSSVEGAMAIFRDINNLTKETIEKTKKTLSERPNLPRSEGESSETPIDDSHKTLSQIAEEAARSIKN